MLLLQELGVGDNCYYMLWVASVAKIAGEGERGGGVRQANKVDPRTQKQIKIR